VAKQTLLLCTLLLVPSFAWAEPVSEEVVKFYQSLKRAPAVMEAAGVNFGDKLAAVIVQSTPENVAQMKIALTDVLLTLHRVKEDARMLKVIPSASGKELQAAMEGYLRQQEKTILETGPEIIRLAADGTLTPIEKKTQISAVVDRNRQASEGVAVPFKKALLAFAADHEIAGEPTVEFREFTPPDRSCKVLMPDITENKTNDAGGTKNTYFLSEHKNGVFMLSYADIAPVGEAPAASQKRLDEARHEVIQKINLKLTNESTILMEGRSAGRELEGTLPDKSMVRIRLIIASGRLYQLWVVGNATWAASPEATRFLVSLELLK
jgi:hypothetical protein